MNGKQRILNALHCKQVDGPPVWLMRQAGRYLPEYRALKVKYSFLEMVKTPELAQEVTLQPLRRFPLDAAILFADILVIPEAMGQGYYFRDEGGIGMDFLVESSSDIAKLRGEGAAEALSYVGAALDLITGSLPNGEAMLGFGGSPWTLATYMVEGGSSKNFSKVLELFRQNRVLFDQLLEKITIASIDYFKMQIAHGVDAIQIFDSWAGICPEKDYWQMSLQWIQRIIEALPRDFPIVLYAKGVSDRCEALLKTGANALSLDWTVSLADVKRDYAQSVCLQGNLNPDLLFGDQSVLVDSTKKLLTEMSSFDGFIFNLGHGLTPQAKVENVEALVRTVVEFRK
jgi:uroporphyrinogen decarboxylase